MTPERTCESKCPASEAFCLFVCICLNDIMETKGGKKSSRVQYEAPLGYVTEEVRPHGGIEKFHCAAYFNCARKPS
ncbi:hypothetical protein KP509_02G051400 [Ceratopteris richardii]|uniref:Uncharacterized protein n=1 Tax=Ceratopteris richardii TaxID=49495 RepID=A0A8T2V5P0_CERRI|nr:hypothetical protein KP509_02G051400 [Ceratopteris richardii]